MRILIISLTLFLSQKMIGQIVIGEKMRINKIIGMDIKETAEFTLSKIESNETSNFTYGNTIIFNKNNTFSCSYSAPCGNDCFPSSTGTFELIDKTHIKLFVKEFHQSGYCKEKNIKLNLDLGTYSISNTSKDLIKLKLYN